MFCRKRLFQISLVSTYIKCVHCFEGKQQIVSFKSYFPSRKPKILDLVHSNVCDPMKIRSFTGALNLLYSLITIL